MSTNTKPMVIKKDIGGDEYKARPWLLDVLMEASRNRAVIIGFILSILLIVIATLATFIAPYNPEAIDSMARLSPPSAEHWFGTDNLGRDILSRVLYGVQTTLFVSIVSILLGIFFGAILGLISGYVGGFLDTAISRVMDIFFGIPTLLLAIALSAAIGTGIINPIISIAIVNIPFFARLVRGPTIVEKTKQYVLSAEALGASTSRIIFRYILPNIIPLVIVQGTVSLSYAIIIEASLGFVGLGVQPPTPSLGNMLNEGRTFLEISPWFSIFPGLAIMLMIMAFNLVGDGMRDALDPMMRGVR